MQLHLVCATTDGKLLHTTREPNGFWAPFEEMTNQTGSAGSLVSLSCAGDHYTTRLHVCAVTSDGHLRHTTYDLLNRSWSPFEEVASQISPLHALPWMGMATIFGQLHLCVLASNGMRYLLRGPDGSWHAVGNVVDQQGHPVGLFNLRCAGDNNAGQLHLCGTTNTGHVLHLSKPVESSTWSALEDLTPGPPGDYGGAARAVLPDGLHVCGGAGKLKHLIRQGTGQVSALEDVSGQVGTPGPFADVVCAGVGDELQVCALIEGTGHLWHTIRQIGGSWSHFAAVPGDPGKCALVSVAGLFIPG